MASPVTTRKGSLLDPDPHPVSPCSGGGRAAHREAVRARSARWADQCRGEHRVPTPRHIPARRDLRHCVLTDQVLPAVPNTRDRERGGTLRRAVDNYRGGPGTSAMQHVALPLRLVTKHL